jgi:glycogen operon protein
MSTSGDAGRSAPLGATLCDGGVNFSLYSRNATQAELLFFDREDDARPSRVIALDPIQNHTYHYWHSFVTGTKAGQIYAYRVHGPFQPERGLRFDSSKVLLDPYARSIVVPKSYDRQAACRLGSNAATAMKCGVVDLGGYDWEGDRPLRHHSSKTIIYEMHVRGFTQHPSSGLAEELRGTYAGLVRKIPYLQQLGITAVELLPVFQFDAQDCPVGVTNYWGYAPVAFFAPHCRYSSQRGVEGAVNEFRDMVKALHRAGIEVILDVVFNHTAEGGDDGPTLSMKGIDNTTYYLLDADRKCYLNYSGTGNTLYAQHPIVRRMILDSLRYWVEQMHVDGFRFDLASVLSRDGAGNVMSNPPLLWDIESDPALAGTKMIAEAWDAAGLYQVGQFIGDSWKEWNGKFRDDARDFFRAAPGSVRLMADRFLGSPEIYAHKEREAEQSINFITCHDGFTLNDLVSYDRKHNQANLEENRDGANDNRSWNCGVEGPSSDPKLEALRNRQVKNFFTVNLFALGIPMLLMGDELRRTQLGNNNAYCQDSPLAWLDWNLAKSHADVLRFVKLLIARRQLRSSRAEDTRLTLTQLIHHSKHAWHGLKPYQPDWSDASHSLAFSTELPVEDLTFYMILNAYWEPLQFELPRKSEKEPYHWRRWIDTFQESPHDIVPWEEAEAVASESYIAGPRSVVILRAPLGA